MNKKLLVLFLMVALLLVATGAVSATTNPPRTINMEVDTSLDIICSGFMYLEVENNPGQSVVHVYCYDYYPGPE
ncbi:hypothetical protein GWN26_10245 [Candidatus Saccharibacteria bacterium]|nr:hypothetical protein [Candidatus Saccharibacteria bacterium]